MTSFRTWQRHVLTVAAWASLSGLGIGAASAATLADPQVVQLGLGVDDIRTVDPQVATQVGEVPIVEMVYEALVRFPDGVIDPARVQPSLAESWSSSVDKKTWTFKLRKGVAWHGNFGEFTADDVVFSLQRINDKATGSPFRKNFDAIESMQAIDAHTLRVTAKSATPDLPALFVNANRAYIVSKKAVQAGTDLRTHPIGTGPFEHAEYRARESFALKRFDAYWQGKPILQRVTAQFMSNASTRELALRGGDVHAINISASDKVVDRLRGGGVLVDLTAPANTFVLHLNSSIKPMDDIRVRQALAHATNRPELLKFLGAQVSSAENSPLPKGYIGHTDDVAQYAYDVERAKALLKEAGFGAGLRLKMPISNNGIYIEPMQIIQEQWRKAGVELELQTVDHPTYHRLIRENISPLVIYGAYRYPMDGVAYMDQFWLSSSSVGTPTAITNFTHFTQADADLNAAREATETSVRVKHWARAQQLIMREAMAIPLFTRKYAMARSAKLDLGHEQHSYAFYTLSHKSRLLR